MITLSLLALFAVMLFLPVDAFATQGTTGTFGVNNTLKTQTATLAGQVSTIPKLIALGSYVIGAFFAVRALFALKGFIEAPDDNPITKVLGFAAVSALLIMLPYIIGVMANSMGATQGSNVQSSSKAFTDTGSF
jgi:hypothetical protein